MGLVTSLAETRSGMSRNSLAKWLADWMFDGHESASGQRVRESTAIKLSAVYACVRVLSEAVASLPLKIYKRKPGGGKETADDHPLWSVLHDSPNEHMTSFTFFETSMAHLALWGNSYALITDTRQRLQLTPWHPDFVDVKRGDRGLVYQFRQPDNMGDPIVLNAYDVLHIPGLSFDGLVGISPIKQAREAIGLGLAAEEMGAKLFGNGARPSGTLETDAFMKPDEAAEWAKTFNKQYAGSSNASKIMLLAKGLKFNPLSIPPEDAQFLETRKFQVNEIARIFKIPPHLIGDLERATFSNIEEQGIEFVVHTIRPWLCRIERAINRRLFTDADRAAGYFCEFLVDALLRGDIKTRSEANQIRFMNGNLTLDDWAAMENMNPVGGELGSTRWVPANLMPAQKALEDEPEPEPEPPMVEGEEQDEPPADEEQETEEEEENQDDERYQVAVEKARTAVCEVMRASVRTEANAVTRAAQKPGNWLAWLDEFYDSYQPKLLQRVGPVLETLAAIQGEDADPTAFVAKWIDESRAALVEASECSQRELPGRVQDVAKNWETRELLIWTPKNTALVPASA